MGWYVKWMEAAEFCPEPIAHAAAMVIASVQTVRLLERLTAAAARESG